MSTIDALDKITDVLDQCAASVRKSRRTSDLKKSGPRTAAELQSEIQALRAEIAERQTMNAALSKLSEALREAATETAPRIEKAFPKLRAYQASYHNPDCRFSVVDKSFDTGGAQGEEMSAAVERGAFTSFRPRPSMPDEVDLIKSAGNSILNHRTDT